MLEMVIWAVVKALVIFLGFALGGGAVLTWVERKLSAAVQDRVGPNRADVFGFRFFGLLHPIADTFKMFFKEDFTPRGADRFLFFVAPAIAFVPALAVFVVIPFGPPVGGNDWFLISNTQMGVLFLLAVGGINVYGHTLGGWSSNNKFSLLGAMRTSAQLFSYEVGLTLSLLGVFMVYGTIMPQELIAKQGEMWFGAIPKWGVFTQPLAFVLYILAAIAETKRAPFDLPEADSELVSGYSTEYSAMRFALFYLAEFVSILVVASFGAVMFLGGWQVPFLPAGEWWSPVVQVGAFLVKVGVLVYVQMLIRWTVPRMRYDQVMGFGWRWLLPLGLANVVATSVVLALVP